MTHVHDEQLVAEAASLAGDSTIPADVRLMQLRELVGRDPRPRWRVTTTLDKYDGQWTQEQILAGEAAHALAESKTTHGNLLTIGGASALWERLIGTAVTSFGSPYLGVGDSTTAAAQSQTDLQAATNKTRFSATASHTDSTSSAGALTLTIVGTADTSTANHRWREWAVFNASTTGRMLNRKVEDLDGGTAKTSAQSWQLTITLALA
jgi:hypothetical protein